MSPDECMKDSLSPDKTLTCAPCDLQLPSKIREEERNGRIDHTKSSRCTRIPPNEQDRRRHERQFWTTMASILGIPSPALYFVQLKQSFIIAYLSPDVIEANQTFYNEFSYMGPESRTLQASRDGLCLVHLGVKCEFLTTALVSDRC